MFIAQYWGIWESWIITATRHHYSRIIGGLEDNIRCQEWKLSWLPARLCYCAGPGLYIFFLFSLIFFFTVLGYTHQCSGVIYWFCTYELHVTVLRDHTGFREKNSSIVCKIYVLPLYCHSGLICLFLWTTVVPLQFEPEPEKQNGDQPPSTQNEIRKSPNFWEGRGRMITNKQVS